MTTKREVNGKTPLMTNEARNKTLRELQHERQIAASVNLKCSFNPMNYGYYPANIIPASSDSSLYYPLVNYQLPLEPLSLPNNSYQPYQHQPYFRNQSYGLVNNPPQMQNYLKPQGIETEHEFTSLPCFNNDVSDLNKRKLSDPGILSDYDDDSTKTDRQIIKDLIHQVNYLKDSNKQVIRELQEVKNEVIYLKQQFAGRYLEKHYEPGMLSDIVREIRDAARVRDEALLSKVKHMIDERQFTMNQLHLVAEKTMTNDRLGRLEEQMKNLYLNNNGLRDNVPAETSNSVAQVLELEQMNLGLRRELQEARAGKKEADAKIMHLDQMLTSLQQKIANGDAITSPEEVANGDNTSLTSKSVCSSSSPSVARVVMSGPVTSL